MEKSKNNSSVVLIVILILLVLGLGGYIVYDKVLSDNNKINNDNNDTLENNNSGNDENNLTDNTTETETNNAEVYQYYVEHDTQSGILWKTRELVLLDYNVARFSFGGNASGGAEYIATYEKKDNKIELTLFSTNCNGENNSVNVFECYDKKTLIVNEDGSLTENVDGTSFTYKKVDSSALKMLGK